MERFFFRGGKAGVGEGSGGGRVFTVLVKCWEKKPTPKYCQINAKGVSQSTALFFWVPFVLSSSAIFKKSHTKKKKRKIQKQKRKTHHQINHHNIRAKVVLLLFAFVQFVRCEWWKKKRRRRALDFFFRFDLKSILDSN